MLAAVVVFVVVCFLLSLLLLLDFCLVGADCVEVVCRVLARTNHDGIDCR